MVVSFLKKIVLTFVADIIDDYDSRNDELDEVVEELLSHHDDEQLDAQLVEAPGRIAHVIGQPGEVVGPGVGVRRVSEELALEKFVVS
jgi:hypothetical protein